ncbi:energy-coupling factor transporter transmembrane component T family protein [Candidatus Hydrogenedentota bacterium]
MGAFHHDLDTHAAGDSIMHRWDPRAKLLGLAVPVAVAASLNHVTTAFVALCIALCILALCKLPFGFAFTRIFGVSMFMLPFFIFLPISPGGEVVFWLGPVAFYSGGFRLAFLIYLKASAIFTLSLALLNTAYLWDTFWAARVFLVPRSLIQLALISLRYLPILVEEYLSISTAATCRCFALDTSGRSYRTAANVAGAILTRGYRRADRVWHAMACRGFHGEMYPVKTWRLSTGHVIAAIFTAGLYCAIMIWDINHG